MDVYYHGHISGEFTGFEEGKIFKLDNGTYWIQSEYEYDYTYEYEPPALILESYGTYYLKVCGKKVEVKQLRDVIESRIDGSFGGFCQGNIYKLDNSTYWIQTEHESDSMNESYPDVTIFEYDGKHYLFFSGKKVEVEQLEDVIESRIDGDFDGFDEGNAFKLDDGTYWIQTGSESDSMSESDPDVTIFEYDGKQYLYISGKKAEVEQLEDVIESRIDGDFEGWDSDKAYKLENGDVWQQSSYHYENSHAYNPVVFIYSYDGITYMNVNGTKAEVKRLIAGKPSYSAGSYGGTSSYSGYKTRSYDSRSQYSGYNTRSSGGTSQPFGYRPGSYDSTRPFSDDFCRESSGLSNGPFFVDFESEFTDNQPIKIEKTPTVAPKKETKKSGGCLGLIVATLFLTFAICGILSLFSGNSKNTTKNNEHPNEVQIPYSAEYYKDENYYDVTIELMKLGLYNIQLSPMNDKKAGFLYSAGQIESIKINDNYDFNSGIWVNKNSPVSISYHSIEKTSKQEFDNEKNNHLILSRVDISLPTYLVEEGKDSTSAIYHAKSDEETKFSVLINNNENWDVLSQYESYVILKREQFSVEAGSGSSIIALAKKNYQVYSVQIVSIWSEHKEQYIHFALVSEDSCKYDYTADFKSIISGMFFPQDTDIRVDFSPNEYKGKNYEEVLATLQNKGFKNVKVENLGDVILGIFSKEGTVASITINGTNDFKPGIWINDQSEVVISYHGKK